MVKKRSGISWTGGGGRFDQTHQCALFGARAAGNPTAKGVAKANEAIEMVKGDARFKNASAVAFGCGDSRRGDVGGPALGEETKWQR